VSIGIQQQAKEDPQANVACPVSVVCTTFNHEKYIRKALDGFLSQKTDFQFEIVVHDDASTDGTRAIIEQYVAAHPSVFKPIFQEVNQYSQGGFKPLVYAARHSIGRYLALCEGDDYWIDNTKLQRQYDCLEAEGELDFCFHSAYQLQNGVLDKVPSWEYTGRRVLHIKDVLESTTGTFAPTASYMIRREVLDLLPDWFYKRAPVGDFFIEMYATRRGGALYLDSPMSVYRVMSEGSWHANNYGHTDTFQKITNGMLDGVNLMEPDFPGLEKSFRWKRAWLYSFSAFYHLRKEKYPEFRKLIELAHDETGFISNKQAIAYLLRRWPKLANRFIEMLRYIKRKVTEIVGRDDQTN
jgi:glycosyltransferase involved in cell wall biosynthesis